MKCGIIGLANVGKTTIFNCISSSKAVATKFAFSSNKSNIGVVNVPDTRLEELSKIVTTQKIIHATVELFDIPGLAKGASQGEGIGNKFLSDIRNTDAIIHVLRCFDDENLIHIEGSVDPLRDKELVDFELQVKDLESVEKKLQKLEKASKTGDKEAKKGIEVLNTIKHHLEAMQSVRTMNLNEEEKKYIDDLFLLTVKPVMYVCNVDEKSAVSGNRYTEMVTGELKGSNSEVLIIAGAMEAEIAELETEEDRKAFLSDMGMNEPSVNKLIRSAYRLLNLQSFLTVGPKEIRAWTIRNGMNAQEAAGAIHSDLERGFIRAEVMKYEDFIKYGSEHACREAGKLFIEGKKYIVSDGDIMNIRFNV
jgi:GTP-binding protein YchF